MDIEYDTYVAASVNPKYPPPTELVLALKSLVTTSTPAEDVARQSVSGFIEGTQSHPYPGAFHGLLFALIRKYTEQNDRFVDFIVALETLPDPTGEINQLAGFNEYMTEFAFDYVDRPFSDPEPNVSRQGWVNVNAFTAKLHNRGLPTSGRQLVRGGQILRRALERAQWEVYHHPDIDEDLEDFEDDEEEEYCQRRDRFMEEMDIRTLNANAPAAAQWIKYCGKEIYNMEGSLGREVTIITTKWTGKPPGWSKERWAFWKERFEWIAGVTALDRKTRRIAKETAEEMSRIEQE
ncbi:hypothetical protein ASPWEDRAFT_169780 [Aspergillus wentii DTO 134E9]|uniref:Uncharacterized protein n=1 Tax=Aspergillus wentii DTO 134E9 TaxID=1073089 RepID=A0A1L9RYA8_ASPWE|nr:uncharacterized protein ASPWEDRAFT_169780 [Aspergillus wentii DTO 134E9]KAI9931377.1 hypothetical protein MW887_009952 [Aspergillus wentii]OJJ39956.1 hypothetical protein ASPWEDRAFT_169780 [Aspergillus wentii DTO 134E9]